VACIPVGVTMSFFGPPVGREMMIPTDGRTYAPFSGQDKLKKACERPPNRGPHKQVFVCGVAERSGPVRQEEVLSQLLEFS
jgi:hypothetical protein